MEGTREEADLSAGGCLKEVSDTGFEVADGDRKGERGR